VLGLEGLCSGMVATCVHMIEKGRCTVICSSLGNTSYFMVSWSYGKVLLWRVLCACWVFQCRELIQTFGENMREMNGLRAEISSYLLTGAVLSYCQFH